MSRFGKLKNLSNAYKPIGNSTTTWPLLDISVLHLLAVLLISCLNVSYSMLEAFTSVLSPNCLEILEIISCFNR